MSDIFLSYSQKDEARVLPIMQQLESFGWSVFWDRKIPPGKTFRQHIKENLDAAFCVVVVWSRHSIDSHWVLEEAEIGRKRIILVPVMIDQVESPFGFGSIHAADLTCWNNDASHGQFKACIDAIATLVPKLNQQVNTKVDISATPVAQPFVEPPLPENFVLIRGGTFLMGSPHHEAHRLSYETLHTVKLNDFAMCRYVVTLGEYLEYTNERKITYDWDVKNARFPAVGVSYEDAVACCAWLTEKRGGGTYRLPTEAEWEYACRAGTTTPFNIGENLTTDQANYDGRYPYRNYPKGAYRKRTVPVDHFEPNGYGLYNMHGNVWEWCGDWLNCCYYEECRKKGVVENPQGPETGSGSLRVLRGGGWGTDAGYCRSAFRGEGRLGDRHGNVGFRLVFVPQSQGASTCCQIDR